MGDSTSLHLGLAVESVKQSMEIEGSGSTETLTNERGKKRPPSPSALLGDDDDDSSAGGDNDGDWLSSGSEEDEDHENNGAYPPFTVDDIPRPRDFEEQWELVFQNPDARRRGPVPIQLSPPFKPDKRRYHLNYNLEDESEINATNVGDCSRQCRCQCMNLFQFIDVKIAGYRHSHSAACAKIYGFVAAQGTIDPVRKFVYKRAIENCEPVSLKQKTGVARLSLTSPTRVIQIRNRAFVEFELHALGEDEKGDDKIIEGCTEIYNMESKSFVEQRRMYGVNCALDVKFAVLLHAVEAQVYIEVLHAPSHGVDLKLCAKTSGFSDIIHLFHGAASEVGFTRSFTVAVVMENSLELYIKGSPKYDYTPGQKLLQSFWRHSFSPNFHGTVESLAKLGDFAEISVKVTWKSYMQRPTSVVG